MFIKIDHNDPVVKAYKRMLRVVRNILIVAAGIGLFVLFMGVPHGQWEYRTHSKADFPTAMDKTSGTYLSVFGWRQIGAGEYGPGCSVITFVPLGHCVDLRRFKNEFTTWLLPENFFGRVDDADYVYLFPEVETETVTEE